MKQLEKIVNNFLLIGLKMSKCRCYIIGLSTLTQERIIPFGNGLFDGHRPQ